MDSAEEYDRVQYDYQTPDGKELVEHLSLEKYEGCSVLDLGCGTGHLTSVLVKKLGERGTVTGIDPDPARIAVAKRNYAQLKNINFLVGSSDDISSDAVYDLVFLNHVMHWIEDKKSAFRNVYKSLKVGGEFAISCATDADSSAIWGPIKPTVSNSYIEGIDVYLQLAPQCGFEIAFSSTKQMNYVFKNIEAHLEYAMPSMTTSSCSPNLEAVTKIKKQFSDSQEVHFDWTKAIIILKRVCKSTD